MVALVQAHGGHPVPGWWDQVRPHSLGWATARLNGAVLVGFVNVAWDGSDHAFLIDTKVRSEYQRRGIATALVRHAALHAKAAGCEWLHVDFEKQLVLLYLGACGFRPNPAGLIHLPSLARVGESTTVSSRSEPTVYISETAATIRFMPVNCGYALSGLADGLLLRRDCAGRLVS
jgi:GNAT superfamily N-acetyltransferase